MEDKITTLKARLTYGVTPAMATPLDESGYRVNAAVVPQLVDFLVGAGAKGLFVGGTTGEGILLDPEERKRLHVAAVEAARGRVPVLVHVGANRGDYALDLAKHAAAIGADGMVAVTPFYYGMDDDALFDYFMTLAAAAPDLPLLVYDIPHMAVNGISPALLARLGEQIRNMAGVKSSHKDAQHVRRLVDAAPASLIILAGNENVALGLLSLGVNGLISGLSTAVPEPFVALTRAFGDEDLPGAQRQQRRVNRLLAAMPAGRRIGAIKGILVERGIPVGLPMPPRPAAGVELWPELKGLLGSD